jgi:spore coat protein CotH
MEVSMSSVPSRPAYVLNRRRLLWLTAYGAVATVGASSRDSLAAFQTPTATESNPFLDAAIVHTISVTFDQAAYDAVIDAYVSNGEKDWLEASATIDGATYERVGLRLKGNSSLMGLRESGDGGPPREERESLISADKPESLPWLLRLDEYENDQNHNGITELVIRSNRTATSLNEAVALDLLAAAGLASQQAAATSFSANDGAPVLRLTIENPKDEWMAAHFSAEGLLFKSEAEGDWSYRDDDAASYKVSFDLEAGGTGDDATDYEPLIGFLDFLNNSDDATFVAELPARLDVDQFAVYRAMMLLIENFDDIAGPGNNSYLYYGPDTDQFTVVPWDMNLAFGSMGVTRIEKDGPLDDFLPSLSGDPETPPELPDGAATPEVREDTDGPGEGFVRIGGPGGIENPLVKRFDAVQEFKALVDTQQETLRADLYESGMAADILARWVRLLESGASALVDSDTIASESGAIAAFFTTT